MSDEMLDYFDENYVRQGSAPKSRTQAEGLWVQSFHCWMLHTGKTPSVFFQKRAATKALFPNSLDISAAGHLRAGETPRDGIREISEETGLSVRFEDLIPLGVKFDIAKFRAITNRQFCNVFLFPTSTPISSLKLDRGELDGMVAISVADGLKLFSGQIDKVAAQGIEKEKGLLGTRWKEISIEVTKADFIPRVDPYYYKIFIISELHLKGYQHLAI